MVIVAFATSIQSLRLSMVTPSSPKQSAQLTVSRSIKAAAIIASSVATSVSAKTYFDTDVYGDKELKIATVNKLKQKLRNAILQDVTVAPGLIQLAINDALGYDASTDDGGPDGSIQFEMNRVENQGLEKAFKVIEEVKNSMQRTNTLSFADVCAFGG